MKKLIYILCLVAGIANAQIVNIPDANFKSRLISLGVDTNTDGNIQTSEALVVSNELNLNGASISDLTGFEAFANVSILKCSNNNLNILSINNMPNLRTVECGFNANLNNLSITNVALDSLKVYNNNLSTINVNNLTTLKHLDCSYNTISNLNISNLTNLRELNCTRNNLTNLTLASLVNLETLEFALNQIATVDVTSLVNLKRLVCYNNNIPILNITNLFNLEYVDCKNNNSTSLISNGLPGLKYLDCSGNNLTTFDATIYPTLENLKCNNNSLTSINLNGLTNLKFLTVANNQLTNINVTGLTALDYFSCVQNQLSTINLSGLNNLVSVYVSNNVLTNITANNLPNISVFYCDNNQLTSLNLSGSTNLNFLYCNDNLLTSLILTGSVDLSWLDCNQNLLTTIDFTGLISLETVICDNNELISLDFSSCPALANLSCSFNNLETLNIKNGYQYINPNNFWHENPNLTFICADDGDLPFLNQILLASINVNNGNVVYNSYCSFTPGGSYNTISGTITFDADDNGCTSNDVIQPNIRVNLNDGTNQGATFTNNAGSYNFYTQIGSFDITPSIENPTWFNFSPQTATIPFVNNNNTATQNFCLSANGVHPDVEMVIVPITQARPGFDATYKLVYRNKGNQTLEIYPNFTYNDTVLDLVSTSVTPFQNSVGQLSWVIPNLLPFESGSITIMLNVNAPTETPAVNIGDLLNFTSFVDIMGTDEILSDNSFTLNQTVVGSFDPNDITCLEGNIVSPVEIGNYLHYNIRFENTGTAPAEFVVVKVEVNETDFDINSLQIMNTSHPVYTRINRNLVEFIFQNIQLQSGGHGNVLLKIKSKTSLQDGDAVDKKANIYFDYNFPIETNDAETIFQALNNPDFENDASILFFPNPTNRDIYINSNSDIKSVQLYDIQGRLLQTIIVNKNQTTMDVSNQSNGVYFLKVISDKGSKVEKIIKE